MKWTRAPEPRLDQVGIAEHEVDEGAGGPQRGDETLDPWACGLKRERYRAPLLGEARVLKQPAVGMVGGAPTLDLGDAGAPQSCGRIREERGGDVWAARRADPPGRTCACC